MNLLTARVGSPLRAGHPIVARDLYLLAFVFAGSPLGQSTLYNLDMNRREVPPIASCKDVNTYAVGEKRARVGTKTDE